MNDAATRLAAARTRLVLDQPFLGALALRLPLKEAGPWCRTTATDARTLFYNRAFVERLPVAQLEFVLAHEALHCALTHFARRGHRVQRRWDLACDFAVNPLLVDEGLRPPPEAVVMAPYRGMTAEEIYPLVDDNPEQETLDQHVYDGEGEGGSGEAQSSGSAPQSHGGGASHGAGTQAPEQAEEIEGEQGAPRPVPLSAAERESLAHQWQQHLAAAAQRAQASGRLSGTLARLVEEWLEPTLPWRTLLAQFLFKSARLDYNYMRPSRREGEMILPSLKSAHCELAIGLDVSGSIGDFELSEFVAEINAIKGALPVRITLLACDSELIESATTVCEPWEELRLPQQMAGGGGTRFTPVFDWIEREQRLPDVLIYFTDADGEFPPEPPPYAVLWLVKGSAPVPWGTRVQLN